MKLLKLKACPWASSGGNVKIRIALVETYSGIMAFGQGFDTLRLHHTYSIFSMLQQLYRFILQSDTDRNRSKSNRDEMLAKEAIEKILNLSNK